MILLTVGTQLPFERLVRAMDVWCQQHPDEEVWGQIGDPGVQGYQPQQFPWVAFEAPDQLDAKMQRARLIVAHAGIGSIISALLHGTPIVIMPRRSHLGEHRNDHQYATAEALADRPQVHIARDENELPGAIAAALAAPVGRFESELSAYAAPSLIEAVRAVVQPAPEPLDKAGWKAALARRRRWKPRLRRLHGGSEP